MDRDGWFVVLVGMFLLVVVVIASSGIGVGGTGDASHQPTQADDAAAKVVRSVFGPRKGGPY
jgi:zona occludens toxin (predicted ATPase)